MTKTMTNLTQRLVAEVLPVTLITAVALAFFGLMMYGEPKTASAQTMCTMDARQCPDGSWVGRSGPNCEFVCGGGTNGNDGTYTNWPGTEYPGGTYEVIPVPQPYDGDAGGTTGSPGVANGSDYVPDYVDPQVMEEIMNAEANDDWWDQGGVTNVSEVPVLSPEEAAALNSGEYNDGTYTNWPGTEHPGDDNGNGQTPPESGAVSFGGTVFYSIGNFFSGVFDWFGW